MKRLNHLYHDIALILLGLVAVVVVPMLETGCDVHEFPGEEPMPRPTDVECEVEVEIDFDLVEMPWLTTIEYTVEGGAKQVNTRGALEGYDMRYQFFVYENITRDSRTASRTAVETFVFTTSDIDDLSRAIRFRLRPGSYTVRVWADFVEHGKMTDLFYDTSDLTEITLIPDRNGDVVGNNHYRNAFLGETTLEIPEEALLYAAEARAHDEEVGEAYSYEPHSFTVRHTRGDEKNVYVVRAKCVMDRPLARYEFITTDLRKFLGDYISRHMPTRGDEPVSRNEAEEILAGHYARVRYTGYMPCAFNFYNNRPCDSWLGMGYNAPITPLDDNTARMGFDYVFVNGNQTSVDVVLDIYTSQGVRISTTDPISVPLKRNHYTLIRGPFFSAEAHGGIGINPNFNGEYNIEIR